MLGRPRLHLRETSSTNDRARELAGTGAPHGTLVTAAAQSAGRGRQGRTWSAPPGHALLMSLVLRDPPPLLPLGAAVAVAAAAGDDARIKWPNDVLVDGRKVSGILAEGRPQEGWAVLGVGVNVTTERFPVELAESATSLRLAGSAATPAQVLADLLESLSRWLSAPPERVLETWRSLDALKGERVRWTGGEGIADGIDDSGALRVETGSGLVTLDAGEVHLLR